MQSFMGQMPFLTLKSRNALGFTSSASTTSPGEERASFLLPGLSVASARIFCAEQKESSSAGQIDEHNTTFIF